MQPETTGTGEARTDSLATMTTGSQVSVARDDRSEARDRRSPRQPFALVAQRTWVFEVGYAMLVLGSAALVLSVVFRRAGWPLGDAFTEEQLLVRLYAAHFRHLDLFPVWSSSDALGLGSPVLLFYQKTFFYVAGPLYILFGGAMKPTLITSMMIFLAVGAYGMRLALSVLTPSRLLGTVGSLGFLFSNYAFTDWLSRGDLPEFSAMMLVPWLLYWCLNLVVRRRVSLVVIPVMVLLVDAHSAIALISILTVVTALLAFLTKVGIRGLRASLPRLLLVVGVTALLLAPMLLAELRMIRFYDPAEKVTHYVSVSNGGGFSNFGWYFYDGATRWLAPTMHTFVQIDFAIWIPIVALAVSLGIALVRTRKNPTRRLPIGFDNHAILFMAVTLLIYLVLQLRFTQGVYDLTPLKVIDYPFRMLSFITPLGILLVIGICSGLYSRYRDHVVVRLVPVLWMASFVVLSPVTASWAMQPTILAPEGQFPSVDASAVPSTIDFRTFKGLPTLTRGILYSEYLPKVFTAHGVELHDDSALYLRLRSHLDGAASLNGTACSVTPPSSSPLESLQLTFIVHCAEPTRLALPISYNAYTTVSLLQPDGSWRHIPTHRVPTDPRLVVNISSTRRQVLSVHLPTLWSILF